MQSSDEVKENLEAMLQSEVISKLGPTDGDILIGTLKEANVPLDKITIKIGMLGEIITFKPSMCPGFQRAKLAFPSLHTLTCNDFVVADGNDLVTIKTVFNYERLG